MSVCECNTVVNSFLEANATFFASEGVNNDGFDSIIEVCILENRDPTVERLSQDVSKPCTLKRSLDTFTYTGYVLYWNVKYYFEFQ